MSGMELDDEIHSSDDKQAMCLWSLLLITEAYGRAQFKASLGLCEMSDRMRANAIRRGL